MYSSGFIKELSYVLLAYGLLQVTEELESLPDKEGLYETKLDYKSQKQISRRVLNLKEELQSFYKQYPSLMPKVRIKSDKLFKLLMSKIYNKKVQLDYLACYILLLRFQPHERDKKLHEDFNWLVTKDSQLLAIMDILGNTDCASIDGDMYSIADQITKEGF